MQTSCQRCIFSISENTTIDKQNLVDYKQSESDDPILWEAVGEIPSDKSFTKRTQVGCQFGKIEKFRKSGANIVPAFDSNLDEFFVIEDRLCLTYREPGWAELNKGEDLKEVALKEITVKVDVIIPIEDDKTKVNDVIATLVSLRDQQDIVPNSVTIVLNAVTRAAPKGLFLAIRRNAGKLNWVFKGMSGRVLPEEKQSLLNCIDYTVQDCKGAFYAVFHPGFVVPKTFLLDINKALNEDLQRFTLLLPYDRQGNGIVVHNKLHGTLGGNYGEMNIVQKMIKFAKEKKRKDMISRINKICKVN